MVRKITVSRSAWAILIALFLLVLLPIVAGGTYLQHLGFMTFLFIVLSLAWNIVGGYAGQTSFGHVVFFGVGAYTTAILWLRGVPQLLTIPLAGALAALYGLLWGWPCLRLRGPYFSIATIGVGESTRLLALNLERITGGAGGLTLPTPPDIRLYLLGFYYLGLLLMAGSLWIANWVKNSRFGLALFAINMDEDAAETLGVNGPRYKVMALMLSGFLVGLAGSLYAQYIFYIDPGTVFGFSMSVDMILMPIIGGIGTLWGPVLGAIVFVVIQDRIMTLSLSVLGYTFQLVQFHLLVYGALLILIILFEPKGLTGLAQRGYRWWQRRQKARAPAVATV